MGFGELDIHFQATHTMSLSLVADYQLEAPPVLIGPRCAPARSSGVASMSVWRARLGTLAAVSSGSIGGDTHSTCFSVWVSDFKGPLASHCRSEFRHHPVRDSDAPSSFLVCGRCRCGLPASTTIFAIGSILAAATRFGSHFPSKMLQKDQRIPSNPRVETEPASVQAHHNGLVFFEESLSPNEASCCLIGHAVASDMKKSSRSSSHLSN